MSQQQQLAIPEVPLPAPGGPSSISLSGLLSLAITAQSRHWNYVEVAS